MKEVLRETAAWLWGAVVFSIIIAILSVGSLLVQKYTYPWWLSIQRSSVEQSKSFTDSNNNMLETYVLEYSRLDTKIAEAQGDTTLISAYQAQQNAILGKMCRQISTMASGTVNSGVSQFLNTHGGCK